MRRTGLDRPLVRPLEWWEGAPESGGGDAAEQKGTRVDLPVKGSNIMLVKYSTFFVLPVMKIFTFNARFLSSINCVEKSNSQLQITLTLDPMDRKVCLHKYFVYCQQNLENKCKLKCFIQV